MHVTWKQNLTRFNLSLLVTTLISPASFAVDFPAIVKASPLIKWASKPAYCELHDSEKATVNGFNHDQLIPIASVSKVFTSYWAIKKLGPHFRFKTQVYITPLANNKFDVHLSGSKDPYFSYEKLYFLFSELNKRGIKNINTLSIDENLSVNLNVVNNPAMSYYQSMNPKESVNALNIALTKRPGFKTGSLVYKSNWNTASKLVANTVSYRITDIKHIEKNQFKPLATTKSFSITSSPLLTYIKDMNIYSNNYVSSVLWEILGGQQEYYKFIDAEFGSLAKNIQLHTGSGLPIYTQGVRVDNLATCNVVLEQLERLDDHLAKINLELRDVLHVTDYDHGTLRSYNNVEELSKSVAAKTGTVNVGIGLAGYVMTQEGKYYFGTFFRIKSTAERVEARNLRDKVVKSLIREHKGKKEIQTNSYVFISFDKNSIQSQNASNQGLP